MINPLHNAGGNYQIRYGGPLGSSEESLDSLNKNIFPICWWYSSDDSKNKMKYTPRLYKKLNINFIGGPGTWDKKNIKIWSYIAEKENLQGLLGHNFRNNPETPTIAAKYFWNTLKENPGIDLCGEDLQSDKYNCGSCGNVCFLPHSYESCVEGKCQLDSCHKGYSNLDENIENGCENKN